MIKYIIVDDEPIAHDIIVGYCEMLPNMQLMKQCYNAIEALDYLKHSTVDLIFLDLNMPKLKGFDFLRTLPQVPKVIVTTAYQEFAIEGYELNIIDYLLKPFGFERFLMAINKAFHNQANIHRIQVITKQPLPESIFLYSDKKHVQVQINEILAIEAAGNYAKVIFKDHHLLIREKLSEVLKILPQKEFIQVHKSFIVAKQHIKAIEGNQIKIEQLTIPIGKMYKPNVLNLL